LVICKADNNCTCVNNYLSNAQDVCKSDVDKVVSFAVCAVNHKMCNLECDCSVLNTFIPDKKTSFEACLKTSDSCGCYTSTADEVSKFTQTCDFAAQYQLSACIEAQLDCPSFIGSKKCQTIKFNVTLNADDIEAIFTGNEHKFVAVWNTQFTNNGKQIVVKNVTYVKDGNTNNWSLVCSYDDSQTIQQLIDDVKEAFSISVGLKMDNLQASAVNSKKRSVQGPQTATISITGTGDNSGASSLSFVMVPVLLVSALFHYAF